MWVSVESLLPTCLILAALATLWIVRGGDFRRKTLHHSLALSLGLLAALLIERPLSNLAAVEMDRLSIAHGAVFGLNAALWAAISVWDCRPGLLRSGARRLVALLAGSAVCLVVTLVLLPSWYKGPLANLDPEVASLYVSKVAEMQPMLKSPARFAIGTPFIGSMILCTPLLVRRSLRGPRPAAWLYVAVALAAFASLSFLDRRWTGYAAVLFTLALTEFILAAWTRLDRWPRSLKRTVAKTGLWAACCYFLIFSGCVAETILNKADQPDPDNNPSITAMANYLADAEPFKDRRRNPGPRLLGWGDPVSYAP